MELPTSNEMSENSSSSRKWVMGTATILMLSLGTALALQTNSSPSSVSSHSTEPPKVVTSSGNDMHLLAYDTSPTVVTTSGNDVADVSESPPPPKVVTSSGNDVAEVSESPPPPKVVTTSGNDVAEVSTSASLNVVTTSGNDVAVGDSSSEVTPGKNIFLFTVDDMGWNDMGYNSGDLPDATPYMRAFAKKGITLTHYYSQPSCTPSRVTMMTGKFAYKSGFQNYELQHGDGVGVPLSHKMMPAYMKDLGYKTLGYGKWNIGHCNTKYLPSARGFDHFLGYLCPGHGYVDHNCGLSAYYKDMIEDWSVTDDDGTTTHTWKNGAEYVGTYDTLLYREETQKAIRKHFSDEDASPLFMWLAQHGIHGELDSDPIPPAELLTDDNKKYLKVLRKRLDEVGSSEDGYSQFFKMRMITASVLMSLDNTLKNLVETLDDIGKLDHSVIFVNSDNGGDTYYKKGHPGNNYPLRSEKFEYFEGGIRVPAFVFAPGIIPEERYGTKFHGLMHHVDLIATFVSLGGGDVAKLYEADPGLDSLDMWTSIIGDTTSPRTDIVFNIPRSKEWSLGSTKTDEGVAVRMGNYKMLIYHPTDSWFSPSPGEDFHTYLSMTGLACQYSFYTTTNGVNCDFGNYLFNVMEDPTERTNLWHNEDYNEVKESMIKFIEDTVSNQPNDYGSLIPKTYEKYNDVYDNEVAFKGNGDYIVPWNCEAIK
jgi:arylsulfatase A-like enzyme